MGRFFQGLLGDLMRLMRTDAPVQWDLATQLAQSVAADGASEPNVDPLARIRLEELSRIAELHVADVTGMTLTASGRPLAIVPTGRAEWARRSLADWRPLIEQLAASIAPIVPGAESGEEGSELSLPDPEDAQSGGLEALIGQWTTALAPAMIAMQVGSVVGHLAQRALGEYELPLPRANEGELLVVPANVAAFADDWSLPLDDVRLFLLVRDLAAHSALNRPLVRARVERLLVEHARTIRPDPSVLDARLGEAGGDLSELTRLLGDPTALSSSLDTPEARAVRASLSAVEAAIAGYVEWVTDTVAGRAIGARLPVAEALRRRRVERGGEERAAEALFGLSLDQNQVDRGRAFVLGVVERAGPGELSKLWLAEGGLPTPAEIEAPGLWVERINLPSLEP